VSPPTDPGALRRACAEPLPHPDAPSLRALGALTLDWVLHHHATRACAEPLPHPDAPSLRALGALTLDWVLHHHATLPQQPIGRPATRAEMETLLREPPPEAGQPFAAVLDEFARKVSPYACRVNHPRFLAFIPGAPTFLSVLGDLLCAGTNFFAAVWLEASGPSQVELVVLDWFRDFLGLPATAGGLLTGGGSEANLTALVVARERLAFADRARAVLYVGEGRHWSMDRAARVIGLLPEQVQPVPGERLRPERLAPLLAQDRAAGRLPWAVAASAGATSTGAVDPLEGLAELCQREGLWLHVDAAYGWAAALTAEGRALLAGIGRADSVTLDPHKWLAQTFEAGGLLVRDGPLLRRTFALRPEYMQDVEPGEDEVNFADRGLALTRRFRALKVWLSLKVLGLGWFRRLIEHCCALARYGAARLRQAGFEVLSSELSIVCFRHAPAGAEGEALDRLNLALIDAVRATGEAFLSSTRLDGRVAIRFCFVNWRTTADDVDAVVALLQRLAEALPNG
jgi:glutamate/tyrosine decarboxylase-like PLP-dependent enzyme